MIKRSPDSFWKISPCQCHVSYYLIPYLTAYSHLHIEIVEKELRIEQTVPQGRMSSNGRLEAEVIVNVSTFFETRKILNDLIELSHIYSMQMALRTRNTRWRRHFVQEDSLINLQQSLLMWQKAHPHL